MRMGYRRRFDAKMQILDLIESVLMTQRDRFFNCRLRLLQLYQLYLTAHIFDDMHI